MSQYPIISLLDIAPWYCVISSKNSQPLDCRFTYEEWSHTQQSKDRAPDGVEARLEEDDPGREGE